MKLFFSLVLLLSSLTSRAQTGNEYTLEQLDVLKTCRPGTIQEENAQLALSYYRSHKWWNMKDQLVMHHPEYIQWHGSLAGIIAATPGMNNSVPFKDGLITNQNFLQTFAIVAYNNDITKYVVNLRRVDCFRDDTVRMEIRFDSLQVQRDVNGCITHGLPYGSAGFFEFQFKDFTDPNSGLKRRLLYTGGTYLDAEVSIKVKAALVKLSQGPSNIPQNPANCKTYPQILREFQDQLEE